MKIHEFLLTNKDAIEFLYSKIESICENFSIDIRRERVYWEFSNTILNIYKLYIKNSIITLGKFEIELLCENWSSLFFPEMLHSSKIDYINFFSRYYNELSNSMHCNNVPERILDFGCGIFNLGFLFLDSDKFCYSGYDVDPLISQINESCLNYFGLYNNKINFLYDFDIMTSKIFEMYDTFIFSNVVRLLDFNYFINLVTSILSKKSLGKIIIFDNISIISKIKSVFYLKVSEIRDFDNDAAILIIFKDGI